MKHSFKRFLSSVLATVMAVAGMSLGMATTAMAALPSTLWVTCSGTAVTTPPDVLGVEMDASPATYTASSSSATGSFADTIFGDTGAYLNKTGINIRDQKSITAVNGNGRTMAFTPTADGTLSLYIARPSQSSASSGAIRVYTAVKDAAAYSYSSVSGSSTNYDIPGRAEAGVLPISFAVTAGTSYLIYANNSNLTLFAAGFEPDVKGTASISGTVSTPDGGIPAGTFTCDGTPFVVTEGAYSITELTAGEYTISYSGTDYIMDDVVVTLTDGQATTQNLTLSAIPSASNVSVTVANATNQTVTFTGATYGVEYTVDLVDGKATVSEMLADTYTVDISGGTIEPTSFVVTAETTSFEATFTKVTAEAISTVPTSVDFTNIGLVPGEDQTYIAPTDVFGTYFTAEGTSGVKMRGTTAVTSLQVKNKEQSAFSFETTVATKVTIEFSSTGGSNNSDIAIANYGADTYIAKDSQLGTTHKNFVVDNLPAGKYIVYAPMDTTDETGTVITSRETRVYSISFEEAVAPTATITASTSVDNGVPGVLQVGDKYYVVSVVTAAQAADESKSEVAQLTSPNNNVVDTSKVVYNGIVVDGVTYTPDQFGGTASDYVFASIVNNDSAVADLIAKIQSGIVTVLR